MTNIREQLIAKAMNDCRHFTGIMNKTCGAGVNYDVLTEDGKYPLPCKKCFAGGRRDPALCDKFATMTREEAEQTADQDITHSEKVMLAMRTAHDDAKRKGFGKGKGGHDSLPCPTGCGGQLYYRVASVNGHMHAKCETPNCVSWME